MGIKVAIIDDDNAFANEIKDNLLKLRLNDIYVFYDGDSFINNVLKFDIVFISCELKQMDGFQLEQLRNKRDKLIIYMSSSPYLALEGYKYNAFRFIIKNEIEKRLIEVIHAAFDIFSNMYLIIHSDRILLKLYLSDVLVIYSEDHYLNFVCKEQTIRSRMSFKEILQSIEFCGFVKARGGTYVNFHHVKSISKKSITMNCHLHVDISKYEYKNILDKFMENKITFL